MDICINNKTITSIDFSDTETAWRIEDAILFLEYLTRRDKVVLGGDVLTDKLEYNYDSWYYHPDPDKCLSFNVDCSIKLAKEYISNYIRINGNRFFVVFVVG